MKTQIENNRLIAEFMGVEPKIDLFDSNYYIYSNTPLFTSRDKRYHKVMEGICEYVKYHISWDWLMPVVGKISSQCEEPEELDDLRMALLCNDIDTAYEEVIEAIKWYNENK